MTARLGVEAKVVLGWREWVALPEFGIDALKAKVDTGARTSALHAFAIERRRGGSLRFRVHPHQHDDEGEVLVEAELVDERVIVTSGGHSELRPVVRTPVAVGGIEVAVELTLSNRALLGFRMLLGREAVRGRFVVDPQRSFCGGRRLRRAS